MNKSISIGKLKSDKGRKGCGRGVDEKEVRRFVRMDTQVCWVCDNECYGAFAARGTRGDTPYGCGREV